MRDRIEYGPSLVRDAGGGQDELAVAARGRRRTSQTHLAIVASSVENSSSFPDI